MTVGSGFEPGTHWWKMGAHKTAPSQLPFGVNIVLLFKVPEVWMECMIITRKGSGKAVLLGNQNMALNHVFPY